MQPHVDIDLHASNRLNHNGTKCLRESIHHQIDLTISNVRETKGLNFANMRETKDLHLQNIFISLLDHTHMKFWD